MPDRFFICLVQQLMAVIRVENHLGIRHADLLIPAEHASDASPEFTDRILCP